MDGEPRRGPGRWGVSAVGSVLVAGVGLLMATLATAQSDPVDVVTDLYVADTDCCAGNLGGVIRLNPQGTQTILSTGGNIVRPVSIARDATTGDLYVATLGGAGGAVGVVRLTNVQGTPTQIVVSSGGNFVNPRAVPGNIGNEFTMREPRNPA